MDHKRVQYLCDVCTQRARSCSHYAVQPSRPVVGRVFKFSAYLLLNDALYSLYSMPNAWKTCPWKCGGGQAGGGGAGGGGVVQDTTNTGAPRVRPWVELYTAKKVDVFLDYLHATTNSKNVGSKCL